MRLLYLDSYALVKLIAREPETPALRAVLERVALLALAEPILETAATLEPADLASFDAIHLASALAVRPELEAVVSYDGRLNAAAASAGPPVLAPR